MREETKEEEVVARKIGVVRVVVTIPAYECDRTKTEAAAFNAFEYREFGITAFGDQSTKLRRVEVESYELIEDA